MDPVCATAGDQVQSGPFGGDAMIAATAVANQENALGPSGNSIAESVTSTSHGDIPTTGRSRRHRCHMALPGVQICRSRAVRERRSSPITCARYPGRRGSQPRRNVPVGARCRTNTGWTAGWPLCLWRAMVEVDG